MDQQEQTSLFVEKLNEKDAEIARLRTDLAEARAERDEARRERDERPNISRADARDFSDDPITNADAEARVTSALRVHAAGVDATARFRSRADKCDPVEVPVLAAGVDAPRVDAATRFRARDVGEPEHGVLASDEETGRTEAAKGGE